MDEERIYQLLPSRLQAAAINAHALRIRRQRYGRRFEETLERLLESERRDRSLIRAVQEKLLRALIAHAYESVPYYRGVMEERGLRPADISTLDDLPKLPLLTRDDVRRHGREMIAAGPRGRRLVHGHTSGTTGSPLSFLWDRETCIMHNAAVWRQRAWAGVDRRDWTAVLFGRRIVSAARRRPPYWQANRVQRQLWLSAFHMRDDTLDLYLEAIGRRGASVLEGYPSTVYVLARHVLRRGGSFPLRCVLTTSETLHPVQRETIESAFACRVFDYYGMAERAIFAAECEAHEGLHLMSEYGVTEFVDRGGVPVAEGSPGYMAGTSLHNFGMPFIRYLTSDVTRPRPAPCSCGRTLPLVEAVTTKAEDLVITPEGRYISPSVLTHPFKPLDTVARSQIVQDRPDRIVVRLVPGPGFDEAAAGPLARELGERLGPSMTVLVEIVDAIPPERSGKFRWVVSTVAAGVDDFSLWETGDGRESPGLE